MALRQRQGGGDTERLTQAEPARQMAPPPSQLFQPGSQRQSSPAEDSRQAQTLSQNLDRVGQSVSRQADSADSQLPLTQKAAEQKSRQAEESARQIESEHPSESAEIKKSTELAKAEFAEAEKARSAGDETKAEGHEEKARAHFGAAEEKATAISKLDSAIKELKDAGAPPEALSAMKLPSFKASAAKELSEYARSSSEALKSAPAADKAAIGSIYTRGILALKAGKKVEAGLHSELAKAYPRASASDKKKIEDASASSSKGRMSAADVMALMSALRTGPSGAGIPPGKNRERILEIRERLKMLAPSKKLSEISTLMGTAERYLAGAEEARRVGDEKKASGNEAIVARHLDEAETLLKELEKPPAPAAPPKAAGTATEAPKAASAETGLSSKEAEKPEAAKPSAISADLMKTLKAEFSGREDALESWLRAVGEDPKEIMSVLRDVYSMRVEGAIKETKDPARIAGAMTILASLEKPTVADLEAARVFLSPEATPKPETARPKTEAAPSVKGPTVIEYGFAAAISKPVEAPEPSLVSFLGSEIEMAGPEERKKLETILESLSAGKLKLPDAIKALGLFYKSRIDKAMKAFGKSAEPSTIEAIMGMMLPLGGAPSVSDVAAAASVSGVSELLAAEKDPGKRKEIESLIAGLSDGKIAPAIAFSYVALSHKRSELAAESKKKIDEERCGREFVITKIDDALRKLAKGEDAARDLELINSGIAMLPEMDASFAAFSGKDKKSLEGRAALEEIYLAMQDAMASGDAEKTKAFFTAASVYAKTGIADVKEYVHSLASKLSKNEIPTDTATFLISLASGMANAEDAIKKSGLTVEKKGAALLNMRAYFGMSASLYEKGDRIGAAYAATLGSIYSSAAVLGDTSTGDWVKSVLGDFSGSESIALGKTFGLKPADWAGTKPTSEAPLWLAASSDSSFSDELSKSGKTLSALNIEIGEHKADIALEGIRVKGSAVDEPGAEERYKKEPGGPAEYEKMKKEVSHALSLAESGAVLSKEAASLEARAAELIKSGKEADAKKVLEEAGSKRTRGALMLHLADRLIDISAAKKDSVLAVHTPSRESGRDELDNAAGLYADLGEKLAAGEAVSADIERMPEADASFRAGLGKIAAEKALEKALTKEGAGLKKAEKRHEELKSKWKGTSEASIAYRWEDVERDLNKAAHYLKKGDLPKATIARIRASVKAEIYCEKAEIIDAYVKSGEKKVYHLPKALSTLDDALGKADKGDFKGALAALSDARSVRMVGSAHLVYESIIADDFNSIAALDGLETMCAGYGPPKEGEPPKSKAYTDAMKVVLDPLRVAARDKKIAISKDADEAAKERNKIKTPTDIDEKKIRDDVVKHGDRRKDFEAFMSGAAFAVAMGERGAHFTDLSGAMGKAGPGIWDDSLALAAGEYLRLGAGAAADPGAVRKSIEEGKKLHLPEIRHTVKGDEHTPDRIIAIPAADLTADSALRTATGRVLALGEAKSLETWNPEMSKSVADADTELTIATTFGLGKDSKGDYKELHYSPGEKEYLAKLKEGIDKSKGWFFGYAHMTSPLSYDDRKKGLGAAGDLGKTIGKKAVPAIAAIADRGEAITDARSDSIKAKMEDEGKLIDRSINDSESKVSASIKTAEADERKWAFGKSVAEFATVNLASAATGGLAAPIYYALKSGITIGEAEASGEWESMGSGAKAMMWANVGLSMTGFALAGTGALVSGLGKEFVAASEALSAVDRITRIGGYGLLAGGTALAGIELYDTIEAGGKWYEVGFILFTNIAPHFATAAPLVIPKSEFAEFGATIKGRLLTSVLTGSAPEEAESMVWAEHEEARYKKYLDIPDSHKDAYHAVEIAIGRELSPEEGLKIIDMLPGLKADDPAIRFDFAKTAAATLGIPVAKPPGAKTYLGPEEFAKIASAETAKKPSPTETPIPAAAELSSASGPPSPEGAPMPTKDLGAYRKAIADEVAAMKKKVAETLKSAEPAKPSPLEGEPPSYVKYGEEPPSPAKPAEPTPISTEAPADYKKGTADKLGALRKRMLEKGRPPETSGPDTHAAAAVAPSAAPHPAEEALPAPAAEVKTPPAPEAAKKGLIDRESDKIREVLAKPPEKLSPDEYSLMSDIKKLAYTGMSEPDAIKNFAESRFSGDVNLDEAVSIVGPDGKWADVPLKDAPSPELGKLIAMSASASVYESTISVGGETKKVVVKVFAEPENNFAYAKKELEGLRTAASLKAKLPDGREVPLGPEPYGFAIVDGKYAIVMEHLEGGDLSHMSAAEIRDCVSPETYERLGTVWKRLTDEGHDIADFQFFVIKNDGEGRKKGDVVLLDIGSLRPRSPDTATVESRVDSAKNLVAMKLLEAEYLPEKRGGEPVYESKLSADEKDALVKIARLGPGGGAKEPWETVWGLLRIPPKARTKAVENALKTVRAGGDLAGEARLRVALRDVELKTGATLLPSGPSPAVAPVRAPAMPPTVTALSPEKPGFVGAMRFDDPDEGTKNLAGFARKIVRDDPVAKAEIAALAADDPVRLAIETLCKDSGFESFAKHFDDAEFDKKWDRIRSRKAAIEKALAEIMKSK